MELLIAPASLPFMAAILIIVLIGVIEGMAMLAGISFSGWLDSVSLDGVDGAADSWLGWLHVGKVPVLVLLVILLTAFAMIGLVFNATVHTVLGIYPYPVLSVVVAFLGSVPVVRMVGTGIARIIPKDESSAVLLETLVGHVAVVVSGTARTNYPAEARVKNEQGQTFYVRVEPEMETAEFKAGESVLLVKQISGSRFVAITNPRPDLL